MGTRGRRRGGGVNSYAIDCVSYLHGWIPSCSMEHCNKVPRFRVFQVSLFTSFDVWLGCVLDSFTLWKFCLTTTGSSNTFFSVGVGAFVIGLSLISSFLLIYSYIDDVLSINNPEFENYPGQMYPAELEIKDTTETITSASYLDLLLSIERDGQHHTSIYDKRDDCDKGVRVIGGAVTMVQWRCLYGLAKLLYLVYMYMTWESDGRPAFFFRPSVRYVSSHIHTVQPNRTLW